MRERIRAAIHEALLRQGFEGQPHFAVERPRDMAHGDYATNAALVNNLDPHELAGKLTIEGVERVEVVGKFINFFLSREALVPVPQRIAQAHAGKRVVVDYTQPNPFKPFHIGHLMSNTIGESLTRLLEATGASVARVNYQGDVGPHVAKAIWGKMQKPEASWGEAYVFGAGAYEEDKKEEIDEINKKVYDKSDERINALYDQGRKESLEHFDRIYHTLGTKFDRLFFESETAPRGLAIVNAHPELFVASDGATVFRGEEHGAHTRVFVNSKGLPTYEAKELGLVELKQKEFPFDLALTTTAKEQDGFFQVIEVVVGLLWPELKGKYVHVSHGMMRFASGKMASRKGNVVTGESLIADLTEKARGREDVAVGAIKYAVLKQGSGKDIVFDPEKSLSLEGDSGPYLQYARTRALSLVKAAKEAGIEPGKDDMPPHASALERVLVHYPDALERAAREMEPHYVTTYLTELAGAFNSWYAQNRVIGGEHPRYGVWLAYATIKTLSDGLHVLGIPAPEEM